MKSAPVEEMSIAAAKWARHVERYKRSGLSMRKFAIREGIKVGTLSGWKYKLERRACGSAKEERVMPFKFVELTTEGTAAPQQRRTAGFEIMLQSGRKVRVEGGFDGAELVRLLNVLEEERV